MLHMGLIGESNSLNTHEGVRGSKEDDEAESE